MSYNFDSARFIIIIASEKTNREDEWRALESGRLLTGQIIGHSIETSLKEV